MAGELITQDWQVEWDGFLLGAGTPYRLIQLDGWAGSPGVDDRSAPRSSRHGSWPGRPRAQSRTVTAVFRINAGQSGMADALHDLRNATRVARSADDSALVVRAFGETLLAFGKFVGRDVSLDQLSSVGIAPSLPLQWRCPDPRLYELNEQSVTISAPFGGSDGLTYPIGYPLTYGVPAVPSNALCRNSGNEATNPVLVILGPITTPRVSNTTLGWALEFDLELGVGQMLTVDTDRGTVLLNGSTDRLYTRTGFSVPVEYFELTPGDNDLTLTGSAYGAGAQVGVTWRSAYL